jgi:hypothetical protein
MVLLHVLGAILLGMPIIMNPIVIIGIERTPVLLISKKLYSCPDIWTLYFVCNCSFTQAAAYSMTSCALQVLVNFSTQFSKCNIVLPTRIMSYKPVLCYYLNDYRTTSSGFLIISGSENFWFQFFEKIRIRELPVEKSYRISWFHERIGQ